MKRDRFGTENSRGQTRTGQDRKGWNRGQTKPDQVRTNQFSPENTPVWGTDNRTGWNGTGESMMRDGMEGKGQDGNQDGTGDTRVGEGKKGPDKMESSGEVERDFWINRQTSKPLRTDCCPGHGWSPLM